MGKPLALGPHALTPSKLPRCDGVYLICLDAPYTSPNGRKTIRHYLGYADNIRRRVEQHGTRYGANVLQVVRKAGITWTVTHLWLSATRSDERRLKNQHHSWRLCPRCNPALARAAASRGKAGTSV